MCVLFGMHHGRKISQRVSDAVCFMMRQSGYTMIDYIDDYIRMGIPSVASMSYEFLLQLMQCLGLIVSDKRLVPPGMRVTCLGALIDMVCGTIETPADKLQQINVTVQQWLSKDVVTKCQLQSILSLLLYVHKCVCPTRYFLNRMLEVLRSSHATQRITLTHEFKCDLYDHKPFDVTLELDACLTGSKHKVLIR